MVMRVPSRKESASASTDQLISAAVGTTDTMEPGRKSRPLFKEFVSQIFSCSKSPRKDAAGKRPDAPADPESYHDETEDDAMPFKTPLEPLHEVNVESEIPNRTDTTGFTAYYLRFDPARCTKPPPSLPQLDRPLSTILEVETLSPSNPGPSDSIQPNYYARTDYPNGLCSSCGLHYRECARATYPSGVRPMRVLNINIYVDEMDCVRLANLVRKRTQSDSQGSRENERYITMYLKHRQEATDKRVDIRIGFDYDAGRQDEKVVAFLCEPKKAQIIAYLGPHAAGIWRGGRVRAYLFDSKGPSLFGITIGQS